MELSTDETETLTILEEDIARIINFKSWLHCHIAQAKGMPVRQELIVGLTQHRAECHSENYCSQ